MKKKATLGNYPTFLITATLTIALFLSGFCGWLALTSRTLVNNMKEKVEVHAFLLKDLSALKIDSIQTVLKSKPFLASEKAIRFISKDQAAEKFKLETNEEYQNILSDNPFRDAFAIAVHPSYFTEAKLNVIKKEVEQISGIFEADFPKNFIEDINRNIKTLALIIGGFVVLMLAGILVLVNNTIRLALYSQRFVVRTMQLVGATDRFIQKPFLKKGLFLGLISAILASLLLLAVQYIAKNQLNGLVQLTNFNNMVIVVVSMLAIGALMGLLSTSIALKKYLKMDIEHLY